MPKQASYLLECCKSMLLALTIHAAAVLQKGYLDPLALFFSRLTYNICMQLGEKFSKSQVQEDDPFYAKTRSMLIRLGLESYEKNFKKGLLNDRTLPLLTDRQVIIAHNLSF